MLVVFLNLQIFYYKSQHKIFDNINCQLSSWFT